MTEAQITPERFAIKYHLKIADFALSTLKTKVLH